MAIVTHFNGILYSIKFYQYSLNFALSELNVQQISTAKWLPSNSGELNLGWIRHALRKSITFLFKLKLTKWKWKMLKCFDKRDLFYFLLDFVNRPHFGNNEIHRNLNMAPFQSFSLRLNYIHPVADFQRSFHWNPSKLLSIHNHIQYLRLQFNRAFCLNPVSECWFRAFFAFILPFNQINEIILKCVHLHSLNGFIKLNATKSKSTNDNKHTVHSLQLNKYIEQH